MMHPTDPTLSKLLDITSREHYHVPKYQREYKWFKPEWAQLLEDIEEGAPGYFMGSLICVNDAEGRTQGDETIFQVVDGQQRLTTLTILLMALYTKYKNAIADEPAESEEVDVERKSRLANIKKQLLREKNEGRLDELGGFVVAHKRYFQRVQPSAQNSNLADYRYLFTEIGILPGIAKPNKWGMRRMAKAYNYFLEALPTSVQDLETYLDKVNRLQFVMITVGSQSDAFTLFESLNNRGVPLSAIDIIKNKLMADLEKRHNVNVDESFDEWQRLINALPEASEQDRYLRHYYNSFKHLEKVGVPKVSKATRSNVISIYETRIKADVDWIFKDLLAKAEIYGKLLRPSPEANVPNTLGLLELQRVGAAPAYQLLLFLLAQPVESFQEPDLVSKTIDLLHRYYLRRNITDTPPTRELDNAHIDVIERCASLIKEGSKLPFATLADYLLSGRGAPASRDKFREALSGDLYSDNTDMCRYLLVALDQSYHSREYRPDLWARDKDNKYIWTIEHVMPQMKNLSNDWVAALAPGDPAKAKELRDDHQHKLGNLTLSGYNKSLDTRAFDKKQELKMVHDGSGNEVRIGYKNGLPLNRIRFELESNHYALEDAPRWGVDCVQARTRVMVNELLKLFALPGESFESGAQ